MKAAIFDIHHRSGATEREALRKALVESLAELSDDASGAFNHFNVLIRLSIPFRDISSQYYSWDAPEGLGAFKRKGDMKRCGASSEMTRSRPHVYGTADGAYTAMRTAVENLVRGQKRANPESTFERQPKSKNN